MARRYMCTLVMTRTGAAPDPVGLVKPDGQTGEYKNSEFSDPQPKMEHLEALRILRCLWIKQHLHPQLHMARASCGLEHHSVKQC